MRTEVEMKLVKVTVAVQYQKDDTHGTGPHYMDSRLTGLVSGKTYSECVNNFRAAILDASSQGIV